MRGKEVKTIAILLGIILLYSSAFVMVNNVGATTTDPSGTTNDGSSTDTSTSTDNSTSTSTDNTTTSDGTTSTDNNTSTDSSSSMGENSNSTDQSGDSSSDMSDNESEQTSEREEVNDVDNDTIDDEMEHEHIRSVEVKASEHEMEIKSVREQEQNQDEIKFHMKQEEGLKIKAEYSREVNATEAELEYSVNFRSIIEFKDINANGVYDENDTVLQVYNLTNFNPISYKEFNTSLGSTGYEINISTVDWVFALHIIVSGEFINVSSRVITPTEMKIDIYINEFPYAANDSALALCIDTESQYEVEYKHETDDEKLGLTGGMKEEGLYFNAGDKQGFFTWTETAMVDGKVMAVNTSYGEVDGDRVIYLTYPAGKMIYHDPVLGVYEELTVTGIPTTVYGIVAAVIGGLAVAVIIIKKRRG